MFVIQENQIAVFAEKATDQFADRLIDYVRDNFPRKFNTFGSVATRAHVRKTITEAKNYGFETERQIVSYLDLGLRFGRVSRQAWAKPDLDPESGDADKRMRSLQLAALRNRGRAH